jgi:2,3-bisphosphoglycerate-independent phosphoglycerate mutase
METQEKQFNRPKPVVLVVLDGWGVSQPYSGNAISQADTPVIDQLISQYPSMTLRASGEAVKAMEHVKKNKSQLHLLGLVSNGCVHSSIEHLQALLVMAKEQNIERVYIHAIIDGRDTAYNSGFNFITDIERNIREYGIGEIASISGRFYAMDRDNHWDRVEKAYLAMAQGTGNRGESAGKAIEESYKKKIYDEEFLPTVVDKGGNPRQKEGLITDNDAVIFFNYRADRSRQITKAFVLPSFDKFSRPRYLKNLLFVCFTEYEKDLPIEVAFPPEEIINTLGEVISNAGLKQLRIAETEKYAHVTYFFNGGNEVKSEGETHELVPSPPVTSYDLKPEMSANEVTDKLVKLIEEHIYDFILVNYANADMVGHTGNIKATIKAVETADECIGRITKAVLAKDGCIMITADHGNAETEFNMQTGAIDKEHSANPVPLIIMGKQFEGRSIGVHDVLGSDLSLVKPQGILSDVAPTVLKIMGIEKPPEMTGRSLI